LPPVIYKFFPSPDAQVRLKPAYHSIACTTCGRYDTDQVFEIGFFEPVTLRFKEDIGVTNDHIDVINDKCLAVLKKANVGGYETKPIGNSGWHAFRVTLQFDPPRQVSWGEKCPECGRPEYIGVETWQLRHVAHPAGGNTFYSTTVCGTGSFRQRDIFVTEDVLVTLKTAGIKGPYCDRFWTDDELEKAAQLEKQGKSWRPKGMTVFLDGR
jgi:hypothetical protein